MGTIPADKLNEVAMQVILHAGDARAYCSAAMEALYMDDLETFRKKMELTRQEITIAHNLQTETIQNTIECDEQPVTLLFIHAQDTLMTIHSEISMVHHMYRMYCKPQKIEE